MKKLMKSLMLFAAAAMALTSCENEAMNEGIEANDTYTMNFVAGAPESKTSVTIEGNAANFAWDGSEEFVFIQHNEKIALGTDVTFTKVGEKANISATFPGDAATEYNHVAVYPASAWIDGTNVESSNFNKAKLNIKASQNLVEGTYDPTADLMVSQNVACVPTDVPQELRFTRLVSVAEMNIKNLAVEAGEKITSVSFAVSETILAGRSYFNLATGEVDEYAYYGASNTITLDNVDGIAANNSSVKVYFTCIPATVAAGETYTVTVTTDKAKYTKSATLSKDLAFEAGKVKAFGVNMADADKESMNDLSGKYFIVATKEDNGNYWGMKYDTTANFRAATDSGIKSYTDYTSFSFTSEYIWNIKKVEDKNAYTISNNDGSKYLKTVTNNNYAQIGSIEYAEEVTITQNEAGYFEVKSTTISERILAFNTNNGQERFAFYKGTQNTKLHLVPVTGAIKSNLTMTFSESTLNFEVGDAVATLPTLSFNPAGTYAVTYSVENTEGNVASVAGNVVSINTAAAGTATVTATFAGNDNFNPATASYTVTVKEKQQGGGDVETIVTANFAPGKISANNTTKTDDKNNSWVITTDATYFGTTNGYIQVGSNKTTATHLTLTSTIENVKSVTVHAAAKASTSATIKVYIGSTLIGTSAVLGNTVSSGGTAFTVNNTNNISGALKIVVSRPNSASGALYFNSANVTYAE